MKIFLPLWHISFIILKLPSQTFPTGIKAGVHRTEPDLPSWPTEFENEMVPETLRKTSDYFTLIKTEGMVSVYSHTHINSNLEEQ